MPKRKVRFQVKGVNLTDQHWATLTQFAKDQGYPGLSSAMRRVIDEWVTLKAEKMLREQRPAITEPPAPYVTN